MTLITMCTNSATDIFYFTVIDYALFRLLYRQNLAHIMCRSQNNNQKLRTTQISVTGLWKARQTK